MKAQPISIYQGYGYDGVYNPVSYTLINNLNKEILYSCSTFRLVGDVTDINISDVLSNYLDSDIKDFFTTDEKFYISNNCIETYIEFSDGKKVYGRAYNNWSYQNLLPSVQLPIEGKEELRDIYTLSNPIENIFDRRQKFIYTMCALDGYVDEKMSYILAYDGYQSDGTFGTFSTTVNKYDTSTIKLDLTKNKNLTSIVCPDKKEYGIKDTCASYCLYYTNLYGGWDSLLLYGNTDKKDVYTRYNYKSLQYGTIAYLNTMKRNYTVHTNWLNEEQCNKMINVFGSVNVYLEDLKTNEINRVIITSNEMNFKTSGKLKRYDIQIVESKNYKIK